MIYKVALPPLMPPLLAVEEFPNISVEMLYLSN